MTKKTKPKVKLTGGDGNIFAVLSRAATAMRRAGVDQAEVDAMMEEVNKTESYHAALGVVMRYVDAS